MDDSPKVGVRAIISLFENHSRNDREAVLNKPMSKSFTCLTKEQKVLSFPFLYQNTLDGIERKLTSYLLKSDKYGTYSKKKHMILLSELREILEMLVTLETNYNDKLMYDKRKLVEKVRNQFDQLDQKLPDFGSYSDDFKYRPYQGSNECLESAYSSKIGTDMPRNEDEVSETRKVPIIVGASFSNGFGGAPFNNTQRSPFVLVGKTQKSSEEENMEFQSDNVSEEGIEEDLKLDNLNSNEESVTKPLKQQTTDFIIRGFNGRPYFFDGEEENDQVTSSELDGVGEDLNLVIEENEQANSKDVSCSSINNSTNKTLMIGGFAGTKHFEKGEISYHQKPLRATSYDAAVPVKNNDQIDTYKRFTSCNGNLLDEEKGSSIGQFDKLKNFFEGKNLEDPILDKQSLRRSFPSGDKLEPSKMTTMNIISLIDSFLEKDDGKAIKQEAVLIPLDENHQELSFLDISEDATEDICDGAETFSITSEQSVYVDAID